MPRPNDQYGLPIGGVTLEGLGTGLTSLPISATAATLFSRPATAATASGNSGDIACSQASEIAVDATVSAVSGTSPTIQFVVERKGADGVYYPLYTSAVLTANGTVTISIGPGCEVGKVSGSVCRLSWLVGGTTPSFTFSASIIRD